MSVIFGTFGNERLSVAQGLQYDLTRAVSLTAWVNDSSLPGSLFMTYVTKNDFYDLQYSAISNANIFAFEYGSNVFRVLSDGTAPTLGTWFHLAGTYDASGGSNNMNIYKDGVLKNSATFTDGIVTTVTGPSIGSLNASRWMKGQLADVRIYNRALSANEIKTIYACKGHDGISYGLVGRWALNDDASGHQVLPGSVKDLTIYGNDATSFVDN
jgi:hypothetical protein